MAGLEKKSGRQAPHSRQSYLQELVYMRVEKTQDEFSFWGVAEEERVSASMGGGNECAFPPGGGKRAQNPHTQNRREWHWP